MKTTFAAVALWLAMAGSAFAYGETIGIILTGTHYCEFFSEPLPKRKTPSYYLRIENNQTLSVGDFPTFDPASTISPEMLGYRVLNTSKGAIVAFNAHEDLDRHYPITGILAALPRYVSISGTARLGIFDDTLSVGGTFIISNIFFDDCWMTGTFKGKPIP